MKNQEEKIARNTVDPALISKLCSFYKVGVIYGSLGAGAA
jgi:hypothetical protein